MPLRGPLVADELISDRLAAMHVELHAINSQLHTVDAELAALHLIVRALLEYLSRDDQDLADAINAALPLT